MSEKYHKIMIAPLANAPSLYRRGFHFSASGINDTGGSVLGQVQDGKLVLVWPRSIRQHPLTYPAF